MPRYCAPCLADTPREQISDNTSKIYFKYRKLGWRVCTVPIYQLCNSLLLYAKYLESAGNDSLATGMMYSYMSVFFSIFRHFEIFYFVTLASGSKLYVKYDYYLFIMLRYIKKKN